MSLKNKVTLVAGDYRGTGKSMAAVVSREGADAIVHGFKQDEFPQGLLRQTNWNCITGKKRNARDGEKHGKRLRRLSSKMSFQIQRDVLPNVKKSPIWSRFWPVNRPGLSTARTSGSMAERSESRMVIWTFSSKSISLVVSYCLAHTSSSLACHRLSAFAQ